MLEATFSPLIPTKDSENFYIDFYNQYSFIQVNDALIMWMKENLTASDRKNLIETLSDFNEDRNMAAVFSLGAGIMNPALMRGRKENRGISVGLYNSLNSKKIDPLDWYEKAIEFLMVYATCEQAMREYLVLNGKPSHLIKEDNLLINLFDELNKSDLRGIFIEELSNGSSQIIKSQNELISAWRYYTVFRHALAHAGGKNTDKVKSKMDEVIEKNSKEFESISAAMFMELPEEYDNFFINPFEGTFVTISEEHLNFFRNMAILTVESLERAIHSNEHKISGFDPYKL